jgi:nucleoside-diphosphate-sugar epimerase
MASQDKKVLVTGHQGFIGSVLIGLLAEQGYEVAGMDTGYYAEHCLIPPVPVAREIIKDIRDLALADLEGFDAVIHLAALSNDPVGNLSSALTEDINHRASVRLAALAKQAGVRRFLYSSSCIMYGVNDLAVVTEESPLAPQTEYARSKVKSEREISQMAGDGFSPVFLRNGTIYGLSPRMRFDTVLNNLVATAYTTGKVVLQGNGKVWRPVSHLYDVCAYFAHVLAAPIETIHNQAFNCGDDSLNHEIIELARFAAEAVPGSEIVILDRTDADQRTYKVDFTKFRAAFPDFVFQWNAKRGAQDLYRQFDRIKLDAETVSGHGFTRLKTLKQLMAEGRVDHDLRWVKK